MKSTTGKLPVYISIASFFIFSLLAYSFWELQKNKSIEKHLNLQSHFRSKSVSYLMHAINDLTDLIFYLKINEDMRLREILKKVNRNNMEALHWEVYKRYRELYESFMKKKHIRQLHFHLPGAISFVRMHRPDKFGDSLKGIRYSIEKVNETLRPVKCFEEGRVFNGFRNVYPILEGKKLLGTVEISYDAGSIGELLRREERVDLELWVRKEVVLKKVWKGERKNYVRIPGVESYLLDRETLGSVLMPYRERLLLWKELGTRLSMQGKQEGALHIKGVTVVLITIQNCKGEDVGLMVLYSQDKVPEFISRLYGGFTMGSVVLSALFSYLLYTLLLKYIQLRESSLKDPLTGVMNRGAFFALGEKLLSLSLREERAVSVVMCDIDHFKRVNDTFGHHTGDTILRKVAKALSNNLRKGDLLARYGGEEFVILLSADKGKASYVAEKLRRNIQELRPEGIEITCSFGVSQARKGDSLQDVIDRADRAMYRAKKKGRNRVEVEE